MQKMLGKFVSERRSPKIAKQYEEIGGSPIRRWTEYQGEEMCKILDKIHPEGAPHKSYVSFRYADPLTEECLAAMKVDGVKRAVAFSQFPQWSCTTSGSSMNELWRKLDAAGLKDEFEWSLIDRWYNHEGYIDAVVERMEEKLAEFDERHQGKVTFLFSAHSVPMKVVEKGDHYVSEVAASVKRVMEKWEAKGHEHRHVLAWQSKVTTFSA